MTLKEKTCPNWPPQKETKELRDKILKKPVSYPNNAEQLISDKLHVSYIDQEEFECAAGTQKNRYDKGIENNKEYENEDGFICIKKNNDVYFLNIDGIGSQKGKEATQTIISMLNDELEESEETSLENILQNIHRKIRKINTEWEKPDRKQLGACLSALQYNTKTNEVTLVSTGDTRGLVISQNGELKHQTALDTKAANTILTVKKGLDSGAFSEELVKKRFGISEDIKNLTKELGNIIDNKRQKVVKINRAYKEMEKAIARGGGITQAVGDKNKETLSFDIQKFNVKPGEIIFLATDGIVGPEALEEEYVQDKIMDSNRLTTTLKKLIREGRDGKKENDEDTGKGDDATGIIIKIK